MYIIPAFGNRFTDSTNIDLVVFPGEDSDLSNTTIAISNDNLRFKDFNWSTIQGFIPNWDLTKFGGNPDFGNRTIYSRSNDNIVQFKQQRDIRFEKLRNARLDYVEQTQEIANNYPEWHDIRRKRSSCGQQLINAGLGLTLHDLDKQFNNLFKGGLLPITEIYEPDFLYKTKIPSEFNEETISFFTEPFNNAPNSIFQYWSRFNLSPDRWGLINGKQINGIIGRFAVRMASPALEQASTLSTKIFFDKKVIGLPITFSVYYSSGSQTLTKPINGGFGMRLILFHTDDTVTNKFQPFDFNIPDIKLATITIVPSKQVEFAVLVIELDRTNSFDYSDNLDIHAVQLELNSIATNWRPNTRDMPQHVFLLQKSNIRPSYEEASFVPNEDSFWINALPTRSSIDVTAFPPQSGIFTSPTVVGRFSTVDTFRDIQETGWKIDLNKVTRIVLDKPNDILGRFDLAFNVDGLGFIQEPVTLEALTSAFDKLWVVGIQNGDRFLFVTTANPSWDPILDTWVDDLDVFVSVPLPSEISGSVVKVEFFGGLGDPGLEKDGLDLQWLLVYTQDTKYFVRLHYDYFMIKDNNVFFRERYDNVSLTQVDNLNG